MATEYYDLDASVNGVGSIESPYNTVTEINANHNGGGDLAGLIFSIKANGAKERAAINLSNASNFTINTYGGTDMPILDGSDVVTPTWVWDAVEGLWYYVTDEHHGLYADDVQLMPMKTAALCAANLNTSFWDLGNTRLYVNIGVDPSTAVWEQSNDDASRANGIYILTSNTVTIDGIHLRRFAANNIALSAFGDGLTIQNCKLEEAGDWTGQQSSDGIVVYGSVAAGVPTTYATNVVIQDNEINTSRNNAVEIWGCEAPIVRRNYGTYNGGGIELWGYITDGRFIGNHFTRMGHGRINVNGNSFVAGTNVQQSGLYIAATGTTGTNDQGHCTDNVVAGNVFHSDTGMGVFLDSGTGTKVYNNTLIGTTDTRAGYKFGERGAIHMSTSSATPTDAQFNNNILCIVKPSWTSREAIILIDDSDTVITGDNNFYYGFDTSDNFGSVVIGDHVWDELPQNKTYTTYDTFAAYQALVAVNERSSVNEDPLFTSRLGLDFSVSDDSNTLKTGKDAWTPGVAPHDYNDNYFWDGAPDIGGISTWRNKYSRTPTFNQRAEI